jgi:hypothetical protein
MHNWIGATPTHHFPDYVAKRLITVSDAEDYRMGQFDAEDVSKFAAAAFLEPERFSGEEIGLECGALTFAEIAQYLSTATGVEVTVKHRTQEETEAVKGPVLMEVQRYGSSARFLGDQAKLTGYGIPLTSFKEFLEGRKSLSRKRLDSSKFRFM